MATVGQRRLEAKMTLHGGPPASLEQKITAGQTYVIGEIVFLTAGALLEIASDTPALIYGVSQHDAVTELAATGRGPVWLADPQTLFAGNVLTAALADYVFLQSDIGRVMNIQRDTTNSRVVLDASLPAGGANARVFVHDLVGALPSNVSEGVVGDTNVRVLFSFLAKFYQAGATS